MTRRREIARSPIEVKVKPCEFCREETPVPKFGARNKKRMAHVSCLKKHYGPGDTFARAKADGWTVREPPMRPRAQGARGTSKSSYNQQLNRQRPKVYARSGGRCEAHALAVTVDPNDLEKNTAAAVYQRDNPCTSIATHVHHRRYRSRRGTNLLENLLHVCARCHEWIHDHGGRDQPAHVLGMALLRSDDESVLPLPVTPG